MVNKDSSPVHLKYLPENHYTNGNNAPKILAVSEVDGRGKNSVVYKGSSLGYDYIGVMRVSDSPVRRTIQEIKTGENLKFYSLQNVDAVDGLEINTNYGIYDLKTNEFMKDSKKILETLPSCSLTHDNKLGILSWTISNSTACFYSDNGSKENSIPCEGGVAPLSLFKGTHNLVLTVINDSQEQKVSCKDNFTVR